MEIEKFTLAPKTNCSFMSAFIFSINFCSIIAFYYVESRFLMKKCRYDLVVDIKMPFSFDIWFKERAKATPMKLFHILCNKIYVVDGFAFHSMTPTTAQTLFSSLNLCQTPQHKSKIEQNEEKKHWQGSKCKIKAGLCKLCSIKSNRNWVKEVGKS